MASAFTRRMKPKIARDIRDSVTEHVWRETLSTLTPEKQYWVVNTLSNKRSDKTVTFSEFNELFPHQTQRIYKLVPAA